MTSEPTSQTGSLGRFVVKRTLGAGGMGVVFEAQDPELRRTVALKVLRGTGEGDARLLREAQALAQLAHPNVVTVHDVGVADGRVFLAMEFIDGTTLGEHLGARRRRWREIVALFIQAGRGLAAAHARSIVHRDFKPSNALVDGEGRVRVTDFGLARLEMDAPEAAPASTPPGPETAVTVDDSQAASPPAVLSPSRDLLGAAVTGVGAFVGTPRYMSPEQRARLPATTRSDQYSFCLALWEALHGELPPARRRALPGWLTRALRTGLAVDPEARHASMADLLRILERAPARRRLAWWAATTAVVAASATAVVVAVRARGVACDPAIAAARLATFWDGPARARARAAFVSTGRPYVDAVLASLDLSLAARRASWTAAYLDACRATHERGEQSAAALDLRMGCLERARRQLEALVADWGSEPNLDGALRASRSVGDIAGCANPAALAQAVPPPAEAAARRAVEALRGDLDTAQALLRAGSYRTGLGKARAAVARARELGYAPTLAEALWIDGLLEATSGTMATGLELLRDAVRTAGEARDDVLLARALKDLSFFLGRRAGRVPEAEALWPAADAAVAHAGGSEALRADLDYMKGMVLFADERFRDSEQHLERAVRTLRALRGEDHPDVLRALLALANTKKRLGHVDEAVAIYEHDLAQMEKDFGPEHPDVAAALINLAIARLEGGDPERAAPLAERAVRIRERTDDPRHPAIASALFTIANIRSAQGRFDDARAALERALAIEEHALGPDNFELGETLDRLGVVHQKQGDLTGARALVERALAIQERARGPEHGSVGVTLQVLAPIQLALGDVEAARAAYTRSLAIRRRAGEDELVAGAFLGLGDVALAAGDAAGALAHYTAARAQMEKLGDTRGPYYVDSLRGLGETALASGRAVEARATLERAVALESAATVWTVASARFQLARALWATGDRSRSRAEAASARAVLARFDPQQAAAVDRWLEAPGSPLRRP